MSINAETAKEHALDPAVLCCRTEAGKVISADDLEDPTIFPDLEDSGLLTITDDTLTIGQVLGTTLNKTTDALVPLTASILDGVQDVAPVSNEVEEIPAIAAKPVVAAPVMAQASTGSVKIRIAKGEGIELDIPLSVAGQMGLVDAPVAPAAISAAAPVTPVVAPVAEEKVVRSVRRDHFRIDKVVFGEETKIEGTTLTIRNMEEISAHAVSLEELVEDMKIEIITPDKYGQYSETIMDVQPIATKFEGDLGEGVTRVLDGVVMVVTGTDANGVQIGEFGSSEGEMDRNIMWGRPGAPDKGEIFIKTQVTIKAHANMERPGPLAAHKATDFITQEIREALKHADEALVVSSEEIVQKRRPGKKRVVIVKEIMGQGAMHDNLILPTEPVGTLGAKANVDLGNLPVVLSPTEVLDGGIHALTCIGPASKENSRHYWREPLVIEAMNDPEIDLVGVMFVGSPQANTEKYYVSKRLGMTIEAMDVDGAIVTTEGFGNNHIDFAAHIEEIGKRGVHVVGDSYSAVQGALVVGNKYMIAMVDNNKSKQGIENEILSNNTLCQEDAIRDLAMLKTLMGGGTIKTAERKWNANVKQNNIEVIEKTTGTKIDLVDNEQILPKSKKRQEIYEID
ncbi:MAG: D-proline reductase (dithiol) proprotein PrdA [Streptococcaceae bacterium]|jgi:D-proline reductase (dithiol) PrdA|nr:D-proline reductase (dithiol) proprotein PrdA [Streptococcaceae bacterium]